MKQQFLSVLRMHLAGLAPNDIDEVIRDHEELIREGVASGRTEESVIQGLGDPKNLAASIKTENRITQAQNATGIIPKTQNTFGALLAFLALAPLNFLLFIGPFLVAVIMLGTFWLVEFVMAMTFSLVGLVFIGRALFSPSWSHFSAMFFSVGTVGAIALSIFALAWITKGFLTLTLNYIKWNIKIMEAV